MKTEDRQPLAIFPENVRPATKGPRKQKKYDLGLPFGKVDAPYDDVNDKAQSKEKGAVE
jgi:hypothetical protein